MDIIFLRDAIEKKRVNITNHATEEAEEDKISFESIFYSVQNGEVIEDYPDDLPFPSCLILGHDENRRAIHSVWSYAKELDFAFVITTYVPDPARWINNKIRREK